MHACDEATTETGVFDVNTYFSVTYTDCCSPSSDSTWSVPFLPFVADVRDATTGSTICTRTQPETLFHNGMPRIALWQSYPCIRAQIVPYPKPQSLQDELRSGCRARSRLSRFTNEHVDMSSALHFRALGSMLNIFAVEGADCIGVRLEGPPKHTSAMWVHEWLRIATFETAVSETYIFASS